MSTFDAETTQRCLQDMPDGKGCQLWKQRIKPEWQAKFLPRL